MRPDPAVRLWDGETLQLNADLTLIRGGGHFPGGTMLHWGKGAGGRGVLCSSDIATVTTDRKFLTFMRSYPNQIPLPPSAIRRITVRLGDVAFDRVYGAWWDAVVPEDGQAAVARSAARYIAAVTREVS